MNFFNFLVLVVIGYLFVCGCTAFVMWSGDVLLMSDWPSISRFVYLCWLILIVVASFYPDDQSVKKHDGYQPVNGDKGVSVPPKK